MVLGSLAKRQVLVKLGLTAIRLDKNVIMTAQTLLSDAIASSIYLSVGNLR
jgi:hypothetical protein